MSRISIGRVRIAAALIATLGLLAAQTWPTGAAAQTVAFPQLARLIKGPTSGQEGDPICRAMTPGAGYQLSGSGYCYAQVCDNGSWTCNWSPIGCPDGWDLSGTAGGSLLCARSDRISAIKGCQSPDCLGNPVNPATGNKFLAVADYAAGGARRAAMVN